MAAAVSLEISAKKPVKRLTTDQVMLLLAQIISTNLQDRSMVLATPGIATPGKRGKDQLVDFLYPLGKRFREKLSLVSFLKKKSHQ